MTFNYKHPILKAVSVHVFSNESQSMILLSHFFMMLEMNVLFFMQYILIIMQYRS